MRRAWFAWFSFGLCLLAVASCSKKKSQGAEMDAGEPCLQAGQAQTGCTCSSMQPPGVRHCGMDFVWSACVCPPSNAAPKCIEGQDVICTTVCPGETTARTTKCLTAGTYDCGCGTSTKDSGTTTAHRDAGNDIDGGH